MRNYKGESIYIAGPECFYANGKEMLGAMRKRAESFGFSVTLPNDKPLSLENEDLRKNADTIFANCVASMDASTAIIADLEQFRGSEPDGGTIYEIGMAYALGLRRYGYTRDARDMVYKHQGAGLRDGAIRDLDGKVLPYMDLPFSPAVVGSCKIVEGDFDDCLGAMMLDIDEERKERAKRQTRAIDHSTGVTLEKGRAPVAYLAGPERYEANYAETYQGMKRLCAKQGIEAIVPGDEAPGVPAIESDDPYTRAYNLFDRYQQHVRNCDIVIANLGDFHGWEPSSDTAFECGMAFTLGKKCYGYMADTTIMRKRIPHYGAERQYRDIYGNDVENFNYPINLMFSSSMPIFEGDFEAVVARVAEDLQRR